MLIEDNDDVRDSLGELLADEGFQVLAASGGRDALAQLSNAKELPGVILLDLMMPQMNGAEFVGELRKNPQWSGIATIVLSADAGIAGKAATLGVSTYVRKPVHLDDLLNALRVQFR
jgi:CheY-like chemotaxis protein